MNEEFNPYNNPEQKNPQPTQPEEPRFNEPPKGFVQQEAPQFAQQEPPRYAQPPQQPMPQQRQPQQQRFEPPYMPNKAEPNRYYPQQNYSNQNRPVRDPKGAARVFGMVSFIIGCFVLPITSMIYFNFRSSVNDKFGSSVFFGMFLSLPAIIFGVVSLMKKTDKKLFPALGITFAGILLLCGFITYFFMVNGTANRYY
jgi:hypothetical protein